MAGPHNKKDNHGVNLLLNVIMQCIMLFGPLLLLILHERLQSKESLQIFTTCLLNN